MRRATVAVLVASALVAAACGSRLSDDELAAGEGTGGPRVSTPGTFPQTGDPALPEGGFGTLESPCGRGDASSATDQGVTDEVIRIATISDPGGLVKGLNQGMHDSMEAFVGWCNDQGGVNGRRLELTLLDAQLLRYAEVVGEACDFAFALVGGGGVFDELGAQDMVDCGLVDVAGYAVSPDKTDSERTFQPMPNPTVEFTGASGVWITEMFPDVVTRAASVYGDVPAAERQQKRQQEAYEQLGFEFVYERAVAINQVNYGPIITAMKNAGVEYVSFTSTYEELVNLQQQMAQQGFEPEVVDLEVNFYTPDYPGTGGDAVEGTYVRVTIWPFEEADDNAATRQYLDIMERYQPDGKVEALGVQAFSAGLLFATAVKDLGDDVTRDRLIAELESIHEWDGGGLHASNDPGRNRSSHCVVIMQIRDGAFVRVHPEEGWYCPPEGAITLTSDWGQGARVGG